MQTKALVLFVSLLGLFIGVWLLVNPDANHHSPVVVSDMADASDTTVDVGLEVGAREKQEPILEEDFMRQLLEESDEELAKRFPKSTPAELDAAVKALDSSAEASPAPSRSVIQSNTQPIIVADYTEAQIAKLFPKSTPEQLEESILALNAVNGVSSQKNEQDFLKSTPDELSAAIDAIYKNNQ